MIPDHLWLKTPLPKGAKGELLVRLENPQVPARYAVVPARCPSCKLGPAIKFVTGWIFLHEQIAKPMNLTEAKPVHPLQSQLDKWDTSKPSTPILKNAVEAKTGEVGVVIQRCPHCRYGTGENRFMHVDETEFECPHCGGRFHVEVKTDEIRAGQRTCYMCRTTKPQGQWLRLHDATRFVCSHFCLDNYVNGRDLT